MAHDELSDLLIPDVWDALPEQLRDEFVTRRAASTGWGTNPRQKRESRRWEPLRPVVVREDAYRGLEFLAARLLRLAVGACRRRASTLGELYRVLRFPHSLPLMDSDRPLVDAELSRYARPDLLIEHGRPRLLETNNSTRLGGTVVTPELAEAYAALCPQSGLRPPPSSVTARAAALARTLSDGNGRAAGGRLLLPVYWGMDNPRTCQRFRTASAPLLANLRRMGVEVVEADLADLRVDAA